MGERLEERLRRAAHTYRRLGNHTAEGMFIEAADTITELRKLVRIAVKYCDSDTCDGCPIQVESGSCPYSDMARELGVEVD